MVSWGDKHRLRKYGRKKDAARGKAGWDRLARLYWRYWHKVHAGHTLLWAGEA
jgi:hypothetical protein